MAETLVLNMKGNFTDRISPGAGKAYRSLEKLDKKMEKIIRQSNRLNGLKINMEISAADTATKKIQSILSLGRQLEKKAFTVRVKANTDVQKVISFIGNIQKIVPQKTNASAASAIQKIGATIGTKSGASINKKISSTDKTKPNNIPLFSEDRKVGEYTGNEFIDKSISKVRNDKLNKVAEGGVELVGKAAKEGMVPKKLLQGVSKVASKVKSLPVAKGIGKAWKGLGKAAPGVADFAFSAFNIAAAKPKDRAKTAFKEGGGLVGGALAGLGGMKVGAAVGTAIGGPVGTVVGGGIGFVGSVLGTMIGERAGGKLYDGYQNLKKSVKNIKLPKPLAKAGGFLKRGVKGIKNFLTPKTPKTPTKPSDKIDPYGVSNDTYGDYMYNPGFKYGYDTVTKDQKKKVKQKKGQKQRQGLPLDGKQAGKTVGKGAGNIFASTIKQTKKGLNSVDKGAKGAKKGMSGVGKSSKKAQGNIKGLGSSSNGSQKQVQGLGDGSQNAAGMIEGMGGSAIGVVDSLVMLSGAAQMAAASLASISFFGLMGGGGIQKNANGSFVGGKTLSWVGEDGPEVIIPLGGKRRKRGLDLWQQAGAMLGVSQHADGGFAGGGTLAGGRSGKKKAPVSVSVGNITIQLKGGQDGDGKNIDLLKVLKEQKNQVSDEICRILADALESAYQNIPAVQ